MFLFTQDSAERCGSIGKAQSKRAAGSPLQEDKEFAAKVIAKLEEKEEDEDALIEQRRKRRQELLAKLQQEQELASEAPEGAFKDSWSAGSFQQSLKTFHLSWDSCWDACCLFHFSEGSHVFADAVAQPTASELSKQPSLSHQESEPPPERVTTAVVTVNGSAEPLQGNNPITRVLSPNEAIDEHAASEAQVRSCVWQV